MIVVLMSIDPMTFANIEDISSKISSNFKVKKIIQNFEELSHQLYNAHIDSRVEYSKICYPSQRDKA